MCFFFPAEVVNAPTTRRLEESGRKMYQSHRHIRHQSGNITRDVEIYWVTLAFYVCAGVIIFACVLNALSRRIKMLVGL